MKDHGLKVIDAAAYRLNPSQYELRKGNEDGAPLCPYGNHYDWIGYDIINKEYIRLTKSVFKKLIVEKNNFI